MSYKSIIAKEANSVQDAGIATKILQHLDIIRNNKSDSSARRWVWELIQNAKDVRYDNHPVSIKIELLQDKLKFIHSGKPFKIKNVLSIINQISSKAESKDSTGMFGTGFITTHQLSEIVDLEGLVHDSYVNENGEKIHLPFKKFKITLDRSGDNISDITNSVKKSLDIVRKLDDFPDILEDDEGFNTCLSYDLKTEYSKKIAQKGFDDLKYSVMYSLIFVDGISDIEILDHINNSKTIYKKESVTPLTSSIFNCILSCNNEKSSFLLVKSTTGTSIAVPISHENSFEKIHQNTPKLYVDFPLIGSENFPLPFILHSKTMYPHEKRDWIPISENDTQHSNNNKEILLESVKMYKDLIDFTSENSYENFHNISQLIKIPERADLDRDWFMGNIHFEILEILKNSKIFHSKGECVALNSGFSLPFSKVSTSEAVKIGEILSLIENYKVVDLCDIESWNELILKFPSEYQEKFCCVDLDSIYENFLYKTEISQIKDENFINLVKKIYEVMMENEDYLKKIKSDQIAIFPNMEKPAKLLTTEKIVNSKDIPLELIEIFQRIDTEDFSTYQHANFKKFNVKVDLLHKDFILPENSGVKGRTIRYYLESLKRVYSYFCSYTLPKGSQLEFDKINIAVAALRGETKLLNILKAFSTNDFKNYIDNMEFKLILKGNDEYFNEFYYYNISKIAKNIELYSDLTSLEDAYALTNQEFFNNFNSYVEFTIEQKMFSEIKIKRIFLNRNDEFRDIYYLYKNNGIFEEFIEISKYLAAVPSNKNYVNYSNKLLNSKLKISETMSIFTNTDVSACISRSIDVLLGLGELKNQDDRHQEACAMLLSWINDNPEQAQEFFPNYASEESRMRLLSSKTASIINKNLNEYKKSLSMLGINSPKDLKTAIENGTIHFNNQKEHEPSHEETQLLENICTDDDDYYYGLGTYQEKYDYLREIGNTGEIKAYEILIKKYTDLGFIIKDKTNNQCILENEQKSITIDKPDTEFYKQAGWDISVTHFVGVETQVDYFEVKTSTCKTFDNFIEISNSQISMAFANPKNYHVFFVYLTPKILTFRNYFIETSIFNDCFNPNLELKFENLQLRIHTS